MSAEHPRTAQQRHEVEAIYARTMEASCLRALQRCGAEDRPEIDSERQRYAAMARSHETTAQLWRLVRTPANDFAAVARPIPQAEKETA